MSHSRDPLRHLSRTRGAGQSTIAAMFNGPVSDVVSPLVWCALAWGMLVGTLPILLFNAKPSLLALVAGLACVVGAAWIGWKVPAAIKSMDNFQLGARGERAVATLLAELGKDGFVLINDVPSEDGASNIDHILIGQPGVIVIETKTLTKPANLKPGEKATVTAKDGKLLRHGLPLDRDPIGQARACADHVKRMLTPLPDARGIPVHAVVAFPGWWIDIKGPVNEVHVINPKRIFNLVGGLEERSRTRLSVEQVGRIYEVLAKDATRAIEDDAESK